MKGREMPRTVASLLGWRLLARRIALGLTQAEVAELVQMSRATVARAEAGGELMEPSTYRRLAEALDIEYFTLIELKPTAPTPPGVTVLPSGWLCPRCQRSNAPTVSACLCEREREAQAVTWR